MNILLYSGDQTSELSVRSTFSLLHFFLSPYYFIQKVNQEILEKDGWEKNAALLVMPGGETALYETKLSKKVNWKILEYIRKGGRYIGIAAGACYASALIESRCNNNHTKQTESGGLVIFPGTVQDSVFSKITSHNDSDPHITLIQIEDVFNENLNCLYFYHRGGTLFVNADHFLNTRILASYKEIDVDCESESKAAVIHCKVGEGQAVLFGVHPEYSILNEDIEKANKEGSSLFDDSLSIEKQKIAFLKHIFQLLNLQTVSKPLISIKSTNLHLFSEFPDIIEKTANVLYSISEKITEKYAIKCENDIFYLKETSQIPVSISIRNYLNDFHKYDYNKIPKYIKIHRDLPSITEIPFFNYNIYFKNLLKLRTLEEKAYQLGNIILYGEILTSSQTLLDKNLKFLKNLPTGLVLLATQQTEGRGRKSNIWVSQLGSLTFSLVIRHSEYSKSSSIVFIQYLVSLAIVEAIKTYDTYYNELDVHIKWPNDICIKHLKGSTNKPTFILNDIGYTKIGGILISSSYIDNTFLMAIGCGINLTNSFPASLELFIKNLNTERASRKQPLLSEITLEKMLAHIMTTLEIMYYKFSSNVMGFKLFEQQYYKHWLHSNQIVTLENTKSKAVVTGINMTHGGLIVESIENGGKKGKTLEFLPDLNSFDITQGIIKNKV
ncbi:hypothetical protein PORY_000497 [Pneumocystis oryctolagi]|uniref:Uncharacterized protein n=1 Tax=Pneumocystis oryctolagi TaxID=42067 RepID=A0ACB7CH72_9ASCO|nr:hypothetical protein PORY_000497 [Pneumocystis oryctolagi]